MRAFMLAGTPRLARERSQVDRKTLPGAAHKPSLVAQGGLKCPPWWSHRSSAYCPSARQSRHSRGAFIVVEHTAQTRTSANAANDAARRRRTCDQRVLQALVIALVMIVRAVFRDRPS